MATEMLPLRFRLKFTAISVNELLKESKPKHERETFIKTGTQEIQELEVFRIIVLRLALNTLALFNFVLEGIGVGIWRGSNGCLRARGRDDDKFVFDRDFDNRTPRIIYPLLLRARTEVLL